MVAGCRAAHGAEWEATRSVAGRLGIGAAETVRTPVRATGVDAGTRVGAKSKDSPELHKLRSEVRELRRAVSDESPQALIARVHAADYGARGSRRAWPTLNRSGAPVAR